VKRVAEGLDAESAQHWLSVLAENGIAATLEGGDVLVEDAQLEAAQALFADPFADEQGDGDDDGGPAAEIPPLGPDDRTVLLGRTDDVVAAQRLVDILNAAGIYAATDDGSKGDMFGGAPQVSVLVAERDHERALNELVAFAQEHPEVFEGPQVITPGEVVEALLSAPLGQVRLRTRR
jgi:hypothetical protein